MSTPAIAQAVLKRIERRYAADEPLSSIARNEKVSLSTVKKNTRHLPRRTPGNRLNPVILAEVKDLSAQNLTQAAIAQKLGRSTASVRRYQRASGIKPGPRGRARKTAADRAR